MFTEKLNKMRLVINGKEKVFSPETAPATLSALLAQMELDEATVVAEIDGKIVPRNAFSTTPLKDGMHLELVRFVAGG